MPWDNTDADVQSVFSELPFVLPSGYPSESFRRHPDHLYSIYLYCDCCTAVKGLAAKSIIDIMPVVTNISLVDKHNKEFVAIGYECMGEFGIEGRRYFRKGGDNRTHQIHIFEQSNHKDINRHIAVRDFLRTHPDIALEYGELKMELAYRFSEDIEGYCTGKDAFVKQLEKDALLWYQNNESYKTR